MEKEILFVFNPWWEERDVRKELTKEFKREIFKKLIKDINIRQITAIYGLRRVGKSVCLFQLIKYLIDNKISPNNILYFSFDKKVSDLHEIFDKYEEINALKINEGKFFFFLDEIQKLEDWQNKLKIYYDMYPNIKFFISGSSHLGLLRKGSESLAGRIKFIDLEPLSFNEWLNLNKIEIDNKRVLIYEKILRNNLIDYLKTPFPEIANLKENLSIKEYIEDMILNTVISYDIKKEFNDVDTTLLEDLKNLFFKEPGMILNVDKLARDFGRGKENLLKHIYYLEKGLIIKIIRNYRKGELSSSRKLKRVYPYHPSFCYWRIQGDNEGKFIESAFVSILNSKYYWREKDKEVDIILNKVPIEIKYKETIKAEDLKSISYFIDKFKIRKGFVITKSYEDKSKSIHCIPAWKVAFNKNEVDSSEKHL